MRSCLGHKRKTLMTFLTANAVDEGMYIFSPFLCPIRWKMKEKAKQMKTAPFGRIKSFKNVAFQQPEGKYIVGKGKDFKLDVLPAS